MPIKMQVLLLSAAAVISPAFAGENSSDLDMARHAIAYTLLNAQSPKGRYACSTDNYACSGPDKSDMALALLARIQGKEANRAIAALSAFKLDGHLSETYTCLVARRAASIRPELKSLKPADARASCLAFAARLIDRSTLYRDLAPTSICATESDIASRLKELSLLTSTSCDSGEEE